MTDKTQLSELARAYLAHYEAIEAGWLALSADIPQILENAAEILRREHGESVVFTGEHLQQTWSGPGLATHSGFALTLRFFWSAGAPLQPRFTLNQDASGHSEVPRSMAHLFEAEFWAHWRAGLPVVPLDLLGNHPEKAIVEAWAKASAWIAVFQRSEAVCARLIGFNLLVHCSNLLASKADRLLELGASLGHRPTEVRGEDGWPLYVQLDWHSPRGPQCWTLTYAPMGTGDVYRAEEERLWLVLYDGRNLGISLPLAIAELWRGFPVLQDFSAVLQGLIQEGKGAMPALASLEKGATQVVEVWIERLRELQTMLAEPIAK